MRGLYQGVSQGPKDIQDSGKEWEECGGGCGQELLHRLHDLRGCLQTESNTIG